MSLLTVALLCAVLYNAVTANDVDRRLAAKIYTSLSNDEVGMPHFCYRMTNRTHAVGSEQSGNVGKLTRVERKEDADALTNEKESPYIAVISHSTLTRRSLLNALRTNPHINGVLILKNSTPSPPYSPDRACPNSPFSLYNNTAKVCPASSSAWNKANHDYFFDRWDKPVVLVKNATKIDWVNKCISKYNSSSTMRCEARLLTFMHSPLSTEVCMRRASLVRSISGVPSVTCHPIGDENIAVPMPMRTADKPPANESVMLLLTRMDSFSFFADISPGAQSALTSLIAWTAINHALATKRDDIEALNINRTLLSVALHGEAFDYIGSSGLFGRMADNTYPRPLDKDKELHKQWALFGLPQIGSIVELSMITPGPPPYWLHVDASNYRSTENQVKKMLHTMQKKLPSLIMVPDPKTEARLPPASAQSFLKEPDVRRRVPTALIAGYSANGFVVSNYNSMNDVDTNDTREAIDAIADVSSAIVHLVATWLCNDNTTCADSLRPSVDRDVITRLYKCLIVNQTSMYECDAVKDMARANKIRFKALSYDALARTYVGTLGHLGSPVRLMTEAFLTQLIGIQLDNTTSTCSAKACKKEPEDEVNYYYDTCDENENSMCWRVPIIKTLALSPAYGISGGVAVVANYDAGGAWTESQWSEVKYELFLSPPAWYEGTVLGLGVLVLLISFILTYVCELNSGVLFETHAGAI